MLQIYIILLETLFRSLLTPFTVIADASDVGWQTAQCYRHTYSFRTLLTDVADVSGVGWQMAHCYTYFLTLLTVIADASGVGWQTAQC